MEEAEEATATAILRCSYRPAQHRAGVAAAHLAVVHRVAALHQRAQRGAIEHMQDVGPCPPQAQHRPLHAACAAEWRGGFRVGQEPGWAAC